MGVLMGKGGLDGNVLRIKPPLCITAEDVDFALDVLDRALERAAVTGIVTAAAGSRPAPG